MAEGKIFVGRKAELEQFKKVLKDPKGQAVLVVGQAGMGKSWLVNKMAEIAENHPKLKCGWVRYEVTSNDSVDAMMERMMDDAFHAGDVVEGSFDNTVRRRKQWYSLLETVVPKGEKISKLIHSFERNQQRPTREEFLDRLRLISGKIEDNGRAVFIIDPLEYLERERDEYAEEWAIVVRDLPEKIKFVFAQRPEDALARYRKFAKLGNVERVPRSNLGTLKETAVNELLDLRASEMSYTITELRESLSRYEGHPYALQGALDMIATGTKLEKLPDDPTETGIVEEQWRKICGYGEDAIHLFKAYAILEEAVPDEIVDNVAEIKADTRLTLLAKNVFLDKLLYGEEDSKRIYHLLLAKYILSQMNDKEQKDYHSRAVGIYRGKLEKARQEQIKPDALSAMRLAEHVLAADGKEAFVDAFVNECYDPLTNLGLLDATISLSERALGMVEKGSEEEAMVLGNLGLIYQDRGDLAKAEDMHNKSLEIVKKLGNLEGMASDYAALGLVHYTRGDLSKAKEMHIKGLKIEEKLGRLEGMARQYGNLGLIYQDRGDLDKAEEMHKKSLEIEKKLGRLEGMASDYGNLGLIYMDKGDLAKAEEMHKKSLEIEKKLGRLEGMASDYAALGLVYHDRKELDKAKEMHTLGLEIEEKLGRLEGIARQYLNLGLIYMDKGELDKAKELHLKSLEIAEKLGNKEGMAMNFVNLGLIYKQRGDIGKAREYWEKAVGLFMKMGMPHEMEKVEGWIRKIDY